MASFGAGDINRLSHEQFAVDANRDFARVLLVAAMPSRTSRNKLCGQRATLAPFWKPNPTTAARCIQR